MTSDLHVPIRIAAERSGLTPQRIRMWEKRHGILATHRSATNRRQFTEAEVEYLALLQQATTAGHRIGDLAALSMEEIRHLLASPSTPAPTFAGATNHVDEAIEAVRALNETELLRIVDEVHREEGHQALLQHFAAPLLERIGHEWVAGSLRTLHEHFATAALRNVLLQGVRPYAPGVDDPGLLCATPVGQLHEMGAVLTAAAAGNQGWRVLYLGANLPALEIAAAARQTSARAVALSIVHPADDPRLPGELLALREALPLPTAIIVGGRSASYYRATLDRIAAFTPSGLPDLITQLQKLRG
ncbi:MerR family transcriptional regulator [Actomonas aquatica]|uniref:Cobalamin-dependent protein n=1 Tax=Actomonas aquatica TaxID=2866162 RepID=A0ABZ1C346_9BACT|nr:cobalamin-dependent protein [Opitutus sp. WL0086]WRQ85683.1 cobalamin-dependent protein [Opitutus sp. WL0086]